MRFKRYAGIFIATVIMGICSVIVSYWTQSPIYKNQITAPHFSLEQVEENIKVAERQFTDIRPGLEKSIKWAGKPRNRTEYSIVYIHGFSASKEELRPVPDQVAAHLGANIFFTRLRGHGRSTHGMNDASLAAWLYDLVEAFQVGKVIGNKVILISCSTGGTLVAQGFAERLLPKNIFGAVFFSPNFGVQDGLAHLLTLPLANYWAPLLAGRLQNSDPRNALHAKYWTTSYPTISLIPMMQLVSMVKSSDVSNIKVPALFYFSPDDKVVDSKETEKFIQRWLGPKQIVRINGNNIEDNLNHLITGVAISPSQVTRAVDTIIEWHQRTASQRVTTTKKLHPFDSTIDH